MADAEVEAAEEAVEDEADAERAGDTDKQPIGLPREAAEMDAEADAAVDADGATRTAAGEDGITATTTSPPSRPHSSGTTTTTTAGVADTTLKIGIQARHAHPSDDTLATKRRRTNTTPWADHPRASTRTSTATIHDTRAMHSGWQRGNKDKLLTFRRQQWRRPRWQRPRWQRRRCR